MREETFTSAATGMQALVWSPGASSNSEFGLRTLLYLHGAGGFGSGLAGLFEYPDLPGLLREGLQLDCRVVVPSCHVGEEWQPALISAFLDDFESAYAKPPSGYDLLGYSRGGHGALRFAATSSPRIRSLAVVSSRAALEVAAQLRALPIYICHGRNDERAPVEQARRMHQALLEVGGDSRLVLLPGDHYLIANVLRDGQLFEWQRQARPS